MRTTRHATNQPTAWTTIETLDPAITPTVVSHGHTGRDFVGLDRFVQRTLYSAHLRHQVTIEEVCDRILTARDRREQIEAIYGQGTNKHGLCAIPILGPHDRVHGIQYWFGPISEDPQPPHRAAGVVWDRPASAVRMTVDCTRMAGIPDSYFTPEVTLASFWRNATRFDHHEAVLDLLYDTRRGTRLQSTGTVRHLERREMLWQASVRGRNDGETVGAWGLLEDLTSEYCPPPHPTLEQQGFRRFHRAAGIYLGVIHIPDGTVVAWLTDPPPWIAWNRSPNEIFPPVDRARLAAATAPDEGVVRTLNRDNRYTPTRIMLSPFGDGLGQRLAIGQFLRVEGDTFRGRSMHAPIAEQRHCQSDIREANPNTGR